MPDHASPPPEAEVTFAVTYAVLGDDFFKNLSFWRHSAKVINSLEENEGYIKHALSANVFTGEAWTLTVWESEAHMRAFVQTPVHVKAMHSGYGALRHGEFFRMSVPLSEVPQSWDAVDALMEPYRDPGYEGPAYYKRIPDPAYDYLKPGA